MKFLDKLGKVLMENINKTVVFVIALVLFLYFSEGDLIAGILTAIFAIIAVWYGYMLVLKYKHYSEPKPVAKKPVAKKAVKKSVKKK